ncbi:hypothetical protein CHCC20442_4301 [Bacillus licheniformis]|nr:hypothetical protein [Bacillus licheniformis]TWK08588.1 hypothetical protein CHCC20442_4301 [Bacillus licheniformis]
MAEIKWKSQEEIDKEKEEQKKKEQLPTPEERIAQLESTILNLLLKA